MNGLKDVLTQYLRDNVGWLAKGAITDVHFFHKDGKKRYLPETVGRTLRELEVEKIIAVKDDGNSVQYRYMPESVRVDYIPWSEREDKSILFRENL